MFQADDSDDDDGEEVSEVDLLQVRRKAPLRNFRFLMNREFLDNSILSLLLEQVRKFRLRC